MNLCEPRARLAVTRLDYTRISPAGVKSLGSVHGYVMQSGLSPVLVDLVYLRVSQINNCANCLDMHTRELNTRGQSVEKLALMRKIFDEREIVDLTIAIGLMSASNRMAISFRNTPQAALWCDRQVAR
jgi:AhpD family alkylhydroperoxidase